jgi:type II secretory pathway pseudopilin PulG
MRRNKGFTLVEILIYCALLTWLTYMIGSAIVMCYRFGQTSTTQSGDFRAGATAAETSTRQLLSCRQVYNPDPVATFTPGAAVTPTDTQPFRFAYVNADNTLQPMGWGLRADGCLLEYEYDPASFSAAAPANPGGTRVRIAATHVASFTVNRVPSTAAWGNVEYIWCDMRVTDARDPSQQFDFQWEAHPQSVCPGSI